MAFLDKTGLERLWLHIVSKANEVLTSAKSYTDTEITEWVGDETVSAQISSAVVTKADANHNHDDIYATKDELNDQYAVKQELGDIVSFNSLDELAIRPVTYIEPVQEGSGDASPSNVRPISGWDSVNAWAAGKNLANAYLWNTEFVEALVSLVAGQTYTLSVANSPSGLYFADAANANINYALVYGSKTLTYVAEKTGVYRVRAYYADGTASLDCKLQLEAGFAATTYVPYQGQTLTADLPETVYGGALDWTTGVLTVDWGFVELNGAETWSEDTNAPWAGANGKGFHTNLSSNYGQTVAVPVCSAYNGISRYNVNTSSDNSVCIAGSGNEVCFVKTTFATVDEWKAHLAGLKAAGTPVQVAYKLATPYTIQLTPQQLTALNGTNNVWSNCGTTEVTYNLTDVETDPTLSVSGMAADAKAVGDVIANTSSATLVNAKKYTNDEIAEWVGDKTVADQISAVADIYATKEETKFLDEATGDVIVMNNSAELPLNNLVLYGKTTQFTTTGKNLLNAAEEFTFAERQRITLEKPLPPGTYTVSAVITSTDTDDTINYVGFEGGTSDGMNAYVSLQRNTRNSATITIYNTVSVVFFNASSVIAFSEGDTATVYQAQIEAGSIATDYEPYTGGMASPNPNYPQEIITPGAGSNIIVRSLGKNFMTDFTFDTYSVSGILWTNNHDGTITANGTATDNAYTNGLGNCILGILPAGKYVASFYPAECSNEVSLRIGKMTDSNPAEYVNSTDKGKNTFSFTADGVSVYRMSLYVRNGSILDNLVIKPQIERNEYTAYEKPRIQTLSISTPNGLPGISVTSDGNYTDVSGQMWLCDEIDFARGMYIKRIQTVILDGTVNMSRETTSAGINQFYKKIADVSETVRKTICNYTPYGTSGTGVCYVSNDNYFVLRFPDSLQSTTVDEFKAMRTNVPLVFMYALATPVETPLSNGELTAYRAMSTQYPTTTIYNDAGADMYVSYATYKAGEVEEALGLAQSDWNQNDPNAKDYVKNRTHWVEEDKVPLLDNYTMNLVDSGYGYYEHYIDSIDVDYSYTDSTGNQHFICEGDICTVIWDGVTYDCTVRRNQLTTSPIPTLSVMEIGNSTILDGVSSGNQEPFTITFYPLDYLTSSKVGIFCTTLPSSMLITIHRKNIITHKIDPKYIHTPDWNANKGEPGYIENRTHWVEPDESFVPLLQNYYLSSSNGHIGAASTGQTLYCADITTPLNDYYYTDDSGATWAVKVGDVCSVIYNNQTYVCTVYDFGGPTIGNSSIFASDINPSNEPFIIAFPSKESPLQGSYCRIFISTSTAPNTNITIIRGTEIVHKLDSKFIDTDVIATRAYIDETFLGGAW